jgi:hypothetical protein
MGIDKGLSKNARKKWIITFSFQEGLMKNLGTELWLDVVNSKNSDPVP